MERVKNQKSIKSVDISIGIEIATCFATANSSDDLYFFDSDNDATQYF